jgi:hypothetical protein
MFSLKGSTSSVKAFEIEFAFPTRSMFKGDLPAKIGLGDGRRAYLKIGLGVFPSRKGDISFLSPPVICGEPVDSTP